MLGEYKDDLLTEASSQPWALELFGTFSLPWTYLWTLDLPYTVQCTLGPWTYLTQLVCGTLWPWTYLTQLVCCTLGPWTPQQTGDCSQATQYSLERDETVNNLNSKPYKRVFPCAPVNIPP